MSAPSATGYSNSMLPVVWDYTHPVTGEIVYNVEALCRGHLRRLSAGVTPPLGPADYAESLGFMLGEVIVLAEQKYDPARASSLGEFLNARMPGVLIDYWRRFYGRKGERRVYDLRRLERAAGDSAETADGFDHGDLGVDRPNDSLAGGADSAQGAWALPREWTESDGDGGTVRPAQGLGAGPGAADPVSVDRRGVGTSGRDGLAVAGAPRGAAWHDCVSCGWRHYPWAPNGVLGWHYPEACLACGTAMAVVA